jgi:hypothetical protein
VRRETLRRCVFLAAVLALAPAGLAATPPEKPAADQEGETPDSFDSVEMLLAAIPEGLMPPGKMTDAQAKAFGAWAEKHLAASPIVTALFVEHAESLPGGLIVSGFVPGTFHVRGRLTDCKVRVVFVGSDKLPPIADLKAGASLTVAGQLAARDPLLPATESASMGEGKARVEVTGWDAARACFEVHISDARLSGAVVAPAAAKAKPQDQPKPPAPAARQAPPPQAKESPAPPPEKPKPKDESVKFFGTVAADRTKIVYIVDRSGSMTDSIDYVKYELKRSLRPLTAGYA